ncbi:MAG: pepQ 2 [Firmicutes bacterium]|nr:pepQ 2 [Bacillota bacterium]
MTDQRLIHLRKLMAEQGLDAVIVTKPENRRYFSGFSGSAGMLLISEQAQILFTDFRYIEQAKKQAPDYEIVRHGASMFTTLAEHINKREFVRVGFESDYVTWDTHQKLIEHLSRLELRPINLDMLRKIKEQAELKLIQHAVQIADAAFDHILTIIRPGISELEIALQLEYQMRKLGSEKPAFDTIVASGFRGALPHGQASDKIIEAGDFVTMDFGAVYQGYHSDITRTVVAGKATNKQREIYDIVLNAQLASIAALTATKTGVEIDLIARQIIADAGYADNFGHALGHGVGLAIHEEPRLSSAYTDELAANMVVSVEPGIYLPDWGGVRIEDLVVISAAGCQVLTASNKKLIELN